MLHIGGDPYVANSIYLDSGLAVKYPYIASAIKQPLIFKVVSYKEGRVIAQGTETYRLTEADLAKITLIADKTVYYAMLDEVNNQLLMTVVDPGYNEYYYISYHGNGGSGSTVDNTAYIADQQATILANGFTRSGFTFTGWNTAPDGSGTSYTAGQPVTVTGDMILYAQWIPEYVNITVSANPFEGGTVSGGGIYEYGAAVTATATPNAGYYFIKWTNGIIDVSTDASYTFYASTNCILKANFALKTQETTPAATFEAQDKITGLAADAVYIITVDGIPVEYTADASGEIPVDNAWFGKSISIVKKAADSTTSINSAAQVLTLPAVYTVTFTDGEGGDVFADIEVPVPGGFTVTAPTVPNKTGFVINGWKLSDTSFDLAAPICGNISLVADWVEEVLTGTVTIEETVKVGQTLTATVTDTNNAGTLTYKWYRYNGVDDILIPEATENTYTVTEDDVLYKIYCVVTGNNPTGYLVSNHTEFIPLLTFEDNAISAVGFTGEYDGDSHGITVTAPDGATVYYGTDGESYNLTASPAYQNAGNYTVYYRVTMDKHESVTDSAVVSISKATPTVSEWPSITGTVYVNDTSVHMAGGTVTGAGGESMTGCYFTMDSVDLTSAGSKTTTVRLNLTSEFSGNYNTVANSNFIVPVIMRTVESVEAQTPIINAVYGTEQSALGLPDEVVITVSGSKEFTVPVTWTGYDPAELDEQTLTGTLDLTAPEIAAEVEQSATAVTASIIVDLQENNTAAFEYNPKTATYDGTAIANEISGQLEGVASVSYTYLGIDGTDYAASSAAPTNAGKYEVTATFTMQAGYAVVAPKTATLTIDPKEVGLTWSDFTAADLVYTGTAKAMSAIATGLADGDTCDVSVEPVGDNVNAGTFYYRATALSNNNYKLPENVNSPVNTIIPKQVTVKYTQAGDC